ncbi:hypothetical protein, partial [Mesorhizobium prunaredense]|uniref:hypothetical protein n=1 Tax=Mesorhizobium prunaredense TaxID=1631249 RepID=UPI001AECCA5E
EATARTAARNGDEPGEVSMTRHGVIQRSSAGAPPPATDLHVPIVIIEADRAAPSRAPGRQHRAEALRSSLSASIVALPGGSRTIADTGRKSKSP